MSGSASHKVVYAAIVGNAAIAATKFAAAAITGSSAMLSEAIHSVIDTGNQVLLIVGLSRSRKPADDAHPFGHGKELYFWSLIVAVLMFGVGGGMAVYEGIVHVLHPAPLRDPLWAYAVLGFSAIFEGGSFTVALRELLRRRGSRNLATTIHSSKDPSVFTVFFEDSAALAGLAIAFLGVYLGHRYDNPYFDGAASLLIGLILASVAVVLAYESRGLLVGESAQPAIVRSLVELAYAESCVVAVHKPLTMHLAPDDVLLNLQIEFVPALDLAEQTAAIARIKAHIRRTHPQMTQIFIEAQPPLA